MCISNYSVYRRGGGVNRRITDEVENGSKILGLKAPLLCHDLVSVNGQITVVKCTIGSLIWIPLSLFISIKFI